MPSTGQLALVLTTFFSMAGFVWLLRRYFSRRYDVPLSRFRWISLGIALFGIAFAIAASLVARAAATPVVFRARLEGTAGMREGEQAVMRAARFEVVHPGREHRVSIRVVPDKGVEARGPVHLRLSLVGPGEAALADTELVMPARSRHPWLSFKPPWDPGTVDFRPSVAGRHAVRLIPLHPGIRRLDVKVEDISASK